MPVKEEKRGAHPWIVFIGVSKVAQPKSIQDFATWASGSVIGPRHILTAAHVCKNLDLDRRLEFHKTKGKARLVCIPGFHGIFDANTKVYPIQAQRFVVASKSVYTGVKFTNLYDYGRSLRKLRQKDFSTNDFGMYLLDRNLPGTIPRALFAWPFGDFLDPARKISLLAHGYPLTAKGRLMTASTRSSKAFQGKFAMEDAQFGGGASGGPVWVRGHPKHIVIGVISGYRLINLGGPNRLYSGSKAYVEDPKTGKVTPLDQFKIPPPPPDFKKVGIASRITQQNYKEIKAWRKKR